jgi:hypothetical protein
MVLATTSLWRSDDYFEVLINYFGEKSMMEEGGAVKTSTKQGDGPDCGRRGLAQKLGSVDPKQNSLKPSRWFWIRKGQTLLPHLGFVASAADVRRYDVGARTVVRVKERLYDSRSFATVVREGAMNCE